MQDYNTLFPSAQPSMYWAATLKTYPKSKLSTYLYLQSLFKAWAIMSLQLPVFLALNNLWHFTPFFYNPLSQNLYVGFFRFSPYLCCLCYTVWVLNSFGANFLIVSLNFNCVFLNENRSVLLDHTFVKINPWCI